MFLIHWMPEAENEYYDNLNFWINHNKSNTYSLKIISEVEKMETILSENWQANQLSITGIENCHFKKFLYLLYLFR